MAIKCMNCGKNLDMCVEFGAGAIPYGYDGDFICDTPECREGIKRKFEKLVNMRDAEFERWLYGHAEG